MGINFLNQSRTEVLNAAIKCYRRVPLRIVLIVPFLLQIGGTVGLVGYLSYKNGQQAVEDLAEQLMEEVSARIGDRLDRYLETPQQVAAANHLAWQQGTLDIANLEQVRQQFWQQINLHPSLTGIYLLNQDRETLGYGRILSEGMRAVVRQISGEELPIGTLYFSESKKPELTRRNFYTVDSRGKSKKLVYPIPINFRTLPWYRQAKASKNQAWSPVTFYQSAPTLGLLAVAPGYDSAGQLQAVFACDVALSDMNTFLNELKFAQSGQAFIIERSGNLVATSTLETPYLKSGQGKLERLPAANSQDLRTRDVTRELAKRFGDFQNLQTPQQLNLSSQGAPLFARIIPYRDKYGLDWLIVITVPESDFMVRIRENVRTTSLVCVVVLIVTTGTGILAARWITQPLLRLNAAAKQIADGEFEGKIAVNSVDEIDELTESFNQMSRSLKISFEALKQSEQKFAILLDAIPIGVSVFDASGQLIVINDAGEKIAGQGVISNLPAEDVPEAYQVYIAGTEQLYPIEKLPVVRARNGETVFAEDIEVRRSDGQIIPLEVRASPVFDRDVNVIYTINTFADITDRKKAQQVLADYNRTLEVQVRERTEALQRSEAQINSFFASATVGMAFVDSQLRFVKVNGTLAEIDGVSESEHIGKTLREILPSLAPVLEPLYQQVLATGQPILNQEVRGEVPSMPGVERYWLVSYFPIVASESSAAGVGTVVVEISDRKRLELALQEKTEELERFFNAALDLLCIADTDGYFRKLSAAWTNTLGYSLAELEGCRFLDLVHPDDIAPTLAAIAQLSEQRTVLNFTNRYRHRDGSYCWLEWRSFPVGNLIYATARDITDRKRAEAELLESKRIIEQVTESTSAILYIFDFVEQRNIYVNSQIEELLGYSAEEIQAMGGNLFSMLVHPEDLPKIAETHARLPTFSDSDWMEVEYRMRDIQGEWHWLSSRDRILTRTESGFPKWIVGTATDFTERKQLELALQQSTQKFNDILNTAPAAISSFWVFPDGNWNIEYLAAGCEAISGYTTDEIAADKTLWTKNILPEDWQAIEQELFASIFAQRTENREYRLRHKNGSLRWVSETSSSRWDESQNCWMVTVISLDITDRKQAEEALRESRALLQTLASNIPGTLYTLALHPDGSAQFEYVSSGCREVLEVDAEQILANADLCFEQIHPDDRAGYEAAVRHSAETMEAFSYEWRLVTPSGQIKWVEANSRPQHRDRDLVWHGVLLDVSARKCAEQALMESEARFQQIAAALPGFIYIYVRRLDGSYAFEYVSSGVTEMLEVTPEQAIADATVLTSKTHPDDVAGYVEAVNQSLETMQPFQHEWRHRNPSGKLKWLQGSSRPERRENGEIVWYGVLLDITDRKRAEEAWRQSEFRFQQIAAASPGVIYAVVEYPDGPVCYEYLSPAFEEIHEIPLAEALKNPAITFNQIHPDDRAGYQQAVANALESWELFQHEWRIVPPSGKIKWLQGRSRPERRGNGEIVWHGIVLDVSDRKRAEALVQEREARLRLAMEVSNAIAWERNLQTDELFFTSTPTDREPVIMPYSAALARVHPEDRERLHRANEEAIARGGGFEIEHRVISHENPSEWRWLQVTARVQVDAAGNSTRLIGMSVDITDRKLAEEALRESERVLAEAQKIAHVGNWCCDCITQKITWSEETFRIYGFDPSLGEPPYEQLLQITHPDDVAVFLRNVERAVTEGISYEHEIRIIRPDDGRLRYTFGKGQAVFNDRGEVIKLFGTVQDISDRKQAEEALRESELNFREAQKVAHIGSWKFDCATGKTTWSEELFHIHGLDPSQPVAQYPDNSRSIHPDDLLVYQTEILEPARARKPFQADLRIIRPSGEIRYVEFRGKPIFNERGETVGLIGTGMDVSDRKRAEIALRESWERERTLFQITQKMRQTLDLQTIFRTVTGELRATLACSRVSVYRFNPDYSGQFIAESVAPGWVSLVSNDVQTVWEDPYLQATRGGRYQQQETFTVNDIYQAGLSDCHIQLLEQFQARACCVVSVHAGEQLWGLLSAYQNNAPRQWKSEEIQLIAQVSIQLGVAIQQAELFAQIQNQSRQLQQAAEAAEAANRAKSTFLANMSHELRTPLNAILGFAQLMSKSPQLTPEERDNMGIINRSGQLLLALINDVLDMAKIEAGRVTLDEQTFNLYGLLEELEKMFSLRAKQAGLQLRVSRSDGVPEWIRTDEIKLRQVLMNLISNAIKFTETGSISARVSAVKREGALEETGEGNADSDRLTLHFEVEDTGIGIPETELEKIFEPFLQTRTGKQSQEGTGLGLPIGRKFVQLMGGELTVSSQVGRGSTFKFDIQVGSGTPSESETKTQPTRRVLALEPNQPRYRILIADDERDNRQLLIQLLSPLGFSLAQASDGVETLNLWESWQPHLIFMDVRMPGLSGIEATAQIKAREKERSRVEAAKTENSSERGEEESAESSRPLANHRQGPRRATAIVAVTASSFAEEKTAILEAGCDDFISKPFRESEIFESLTKYLGVRYIYQNILEESASVPEMIALNPADLAVLPPDLVDRLEEATVRASLNNIYSAIDEISTANSRAAEALKYLVGNFDYEQILAAIESSKKIGEE